MTMYLFVGLGNPGKKHAQNRHNVGFMMIDYLADYFGCPKFIARFHGQFQHVKIHQNQDRLLFLKPETFMNLSGQSVLAALSFYKLPLSNLFVFHDELDLPIGKVRLKNGGGAAGHNGLRSIISKIGADFKRIRIGIGHPGHKSMVTSYVLSDFQDEEEGIIKHTRKVIIESIEVLIARKYQEFQDKISKASLKKGSK